MSVNDIAKYKKAKSLVKDLSTILMTMEAAIAGLQRYKGYKPAMLCLDSLTTNRDWVRYNLEFYKMVVETKGERPHDPN